jgi:zinc/manganese transport system permease protein
MNLSIWDIMAPAFFECLILVGIHSYLGLHVLRRKVIFVDLALAQIAALGTTVGFLFGVMPGTTGAYWFSLSFAFIGAAVFSISRIRHEKIPQEAVIGLAYAIAASIAILVIDKAPHGAEHIKEILTGSILWVKWSTIFNAAIVYSLVGVFHYIYKDRFILISENPEEAYKQGISVRFWDFLFYVSFGIVITHSVGTAGVLLVFVFLVVPAIASMLITDVLWKQLVIGWSLGVFVSIVGLYISYIADLPSGPTVVAFYGIMLIIIAIVLYLVRAKSRSSAMMKIALGVGVTLVVIFGLYLMGKAFKGSEEHNHQETALINTDLHAEESNQNETLSELNDNEIENFLNPITDEKKLKKLFTNQDDEYVKLKIANRLLLLNKKLAMSLYFKIISNSELPFVKEEAIEKMRKVSGKNFGYDSSGNEKQNKIAIDRWKNEIQKIHER